MVNMFPTFQFPTQVFFHDMSMQSFLFTVNPYGLISMMWFIGWFKSKYFIVRQEILGQTGTGTVFNFTCYYSIPRSIENGLASFALKLFAGLFSKYRFPVFKIKDSLTLMRTKKGSVFSSNKGYLAIFTVLHVVSIPDMNYVAIAI